ncbi:Transcription factor [Nymphaea thermarum]|nr:Transcription factor [Nymphaea thermarum]
MEHQRSSSSSSWSFIQEDFLEGVFTNLQSARKESRTSDVALLEEQVQLMLREWKAYLKFIAGGKFEAVLQNPYLKFIAGDVKESSKMFRLFMSSLYLCVSVNFDQYAKIFEALLILTGLNFSHRGAAVASESFKPAISLTDNAIKTFE